jgi:hypothetical protein
MRLQSVHVRKSWRGAVVAAALALLAASPTLAQDAAAAPEASKPTFDIYGFAMLDMGYQNGASDPNWFDVLRVTKLPSFDGQYGKGPNTFAGVRQSRLGVKSSYPTELGDIRPSSSSSSSAPAPTPVRRRSACATPGASSVPSGRASTGARSPIPTPSRTRSSTGDRPVSRGTATSRSAGPR